MRLVLCALVAGGGPSAAGAAPLDFLFGGPPLASRPAYRLRRRPAPPLQSPRAEIPLPPPRPLFASDPPAAAGPATPKSPETARAELTPKTPKTPEASKAPETPAKPPETTRSPEPTAKLPSTKGPDAGALPMPPLPPEKPPEIAKPDAGKTEPLKPGAPATPPAVAPSGATTAFTPRSPEDDPQCPARLVGEKIDVAPMAIGPQPDARCTVVQPVRLAGVTLAGGARVEFPEHPTVACTTADSFASFVRDLLAPLAKGTFGAPVTAVWTGPGLECRSRDSVFGAKLSAHGQGLAIDIAQLKLADGRLVEVGAPKTDAETAFETAARAGACGYFHTVLGPGSDAYHRTHWHFDLEVRGSHGDSKYCK